MKIYIAGPMTGLPEFNYPAFHRAAAALRAAGYEVFNPAEMDQYGWAEVDGEWLMPGGVKPAYADYLRAGIRALIDCDTVCLLEGWPESRGAVLEHDIAMLLGLDFTYLSRIGRLNTAPVLPDVETTNASPRS